METQTSSVPPKTQGPIVDEDALVSQVLEIIGGITLEALHTLEEPGERDVWSVEEGDDSVFYSDEDQAQRDVRANTPCGFGEELPVNSVTADENIQVNGDEFKTGEEISQVQQHLDLTENKEQQELRRPEPEAMVDQSEAADQEVRCNQSPELSVSTCGGSLQQSADMQMQPELNTSAEKGKKTSHSCA